MDARRRVLTGCQSISCSVVDDFSFILCLRPPIMFSGCRSVSACFRAYVRPGMHPVSTISYKPVDGISVDDLVEATDELIRFRRSRGQDQGHNKVKHLSELLWRAETSTRRLGIEVSSCFSLCRA